MVLIPFTDDFNRIRNRYKRQYSDRAKAETFAFQDAFKLNIRTYEEQKPLFKLQKAKKWINTEM